MKKSFMIFN